MDAPPPPAPPLPPAPPPGPYPPRSQHPLRRDRAHRVLGGVAAGIARTYGIDVSLVRVIWIIAGVFWIGIPAYVVAWIAIAPGDGDDSDADQPRDFGLLAALALIGIGIAIALGRWLPDGFHGGLFAAPVLLIGGGIAILVLRRPPDPEAEPPDAVQREPHTAPPAGDWPTTEAPTAAASVAAPEDAAAPGAEPTLPLTSSAWTQTAPWPAARDARREARAERRAARPRAFLGPLTVSILLIGAGVTTMLQALDVVDVNVTVALAVATCVVATALVLSAWVGRARGLIFLGLLLVGATAVSSAIDVPLRGGFGEALHHPQTVAALRSPYEHSVGKMQLDLRAIPFPAGVTRVEAHQGVGNLVVLVPSSVDVIVDAHVGAGSINLVGDETAGLDRDAHREIRGDTPGGTLELDLRLGIGRIDVRRFNFRGFETTLGDAKQDNPAGKEQP